MAIDFSFDRWLQVKETARLWWAGQLDRPLIQIRVGGCDPGRLPPKLARVSKDTTAYDFSVSPEDIIDRWDYELSCMRYLGDAFPHQFTDFGPGVLAAFLGARPEPGAGTVWFHRPHPHKDISEIDWSYDPDNRYLRRVKDFHRAGNQRWNGLVQMSMTDLGGNLDVVASFLPGEQLLMDLHDQPEHVERLLWRAHDMWWRCFDDLNALIHPPLPGYTSWTSIFSDAPSYMLQCDFCYMIGTPMFDRFVKVELERSCQRLTNAFYHLDGPGQLAHLDSLLEIKELKGVQWIPGAGAKDYPYWPEVFRKIRRAGKLIQIWGPLSLMDVLAEQLGSAAGIVMIAGVDASHVDEAKAFLKKYGVT